LILVDTSVWVEHLRHGLARLATLLQEGEVLIHPWVIGELACGHLRNRHELVVRGPAPGRTSPGARAGAAGAKARAGIRGMKQLPPQPVPVAATGVMTLGRRAEDRCGRSGHL